jgi:hypothetical protein
MTDSRATGLELGQRVAVDHSIEFGVTERAERGTVGGNQEPARYPGARHDRRQRHGVLCAQVLRQRLVDGHQSSSSMYNRIVPPHVRPTANASSSL